MKKVVFMILTIMMVAVLVACGNGDEDSVDDQEANDETEGTTNGEGEAITAWAWDPNFNIRALELADQAYDGEVDLELEIIENAQDDIVQRLNTSLSSGTTQGMPNIVLIEDYRAQSFLQAYPDAFYPLTDYIDVDAFADYKIETTSLDGEQYGLPFDTGVAGLYIRTDYLEEAGYSVDDVQDITWAEYIQIGVDIKEATGNNMLTQDPSDLGLIRMMIQSAGTWYFEDDGSTPNLANNPALEAAMQAYRELMEANIVSMVSDWSQFVGAFNDGDVASVPTGNWITPSITAEESQSGNWAVVPFPKLEVEGATNVTNLGGSSWYVLNSDGKEAAATFLANTFGSNEMFYQDLIDEIGAIGTYLPGMQGEAFEEGHEFFDGQSIVADFSEWTEAIPAVNYGMHTYAIDDILAVELQNYLNDKELTDVLEDAQSQAETQLR
ncbi:ABC transporter substrate-binding protein [Amphibacillus cookii]|uniref:ABC transporter substrate-binding protein n=1 Tax=Amphibacillus cookii TaxID=767787 RepID=UPI00195BADF9|nr:extracellular solute-binding protein [Amphibacillus cookii]MBM7539871.1 lactose/L-arabinose transport system substrate-binding protein [Amphibacillus cookii]